MKRPLMLPSIFNRVDGRVDDGGEKIRMSDAVGRIKWDPLGVNMGSLLVRVRDMSLEDTEVASYHPSNDF